MAGEHTYTFILRNETGGGTDTPISGSTQSTDTSDAKSGGLLTKSQAKAFGKGMVAYHFVKSFATQIISHETSIISLKTGQNEMQQQAQFKYSVAMRTVAMGESMLMGLMVGGLAGAVAGAAISLTHTMVDISQKTQDLNLKAQLENIAIQRNLTRAGGGRRNV